MCILLLFSLLVILALARWPVKQDAPLQEIDEKTRTMLNEDLDGML